MKKNIYIIWIWWIGISAIARYHLYVWNNVFWSDSTNSELISELKKEGADIIIWSDKERIKALNIEEVVYTEAIPENNGELVSSKELWLKIQTYPEALAVIVNKKKLIAVTWTHWKSTTTSLISLVLKNSKSKVNTIVWTILKEFWNKNTFFSDSEYFVIEACEYKRSFLEYKPTVWVITNIEIDHLDYYKDLDDYISAFEEFLSNIVFWWFAILNWNDENCKKLVGIRKDLIYIEAYEDNFIVNSAQSSETLGEIYEEEKIYFPQINMQIPWKHILFDAQIAFIIWYMVWVEREKSIETLEKYSWVWRRMETVWETKNWNILMSDYGHHPTEIELTLYALKIKYSDKKIFTVFQPHQYNRTLELLSGFKECFSNTDKLVIPNIYESRDTKEDKEKIDSKKLIELINHHNKDDWKWLENTLEIIKEYDKRNPESSIIILMWAGDLDNLRYEIIK